MSTESLESLIQAVEDRPEDAIGWSRLGAAMYRCGEFSAAETAFQKAVERAPGEASYWSDLGQVHRDLGRTDASLQCFQRALVLNPSLVQAHTNLGNLLAWLGHTEAALPHLNTAHARQPGGAGPMANLANLLRQLGRLDEAKLLFERALAQMPHNPSLHWNHAVTLLLSGDYEQGLEAYEWRYLRRGIQRPDWLEEAWTGGDVAGKTLCLVTEQGFGDAIQFLRFARELAERGATVEVQCHPRLVALFSTAAGVQRVLSREESPSSGATLAYLMSVPHRLGTTLPTLPATPYLSADPALSARLATRIGSEGLRVGIAWQGNPAFEADHLRSPPLSAFSPLGAIVGVRLFSLQKFHGTDQLPPLAQALRIDDLGAELDNGPAAFVETAAALDNLDLLICSDSATAHLAGAMGCPSWVVLPHAPDWRWMLETKESPWYPSMRLFRQRRPTDWTSVFQEVAQALREHYHSLRRSA